MFPPSICHTCFRLLCSCGNGRCLVWSRWYHSTQGVTTGCHLFKTEWQEILKTSLPRLSHLPRLHLRVWIAGPVQGLLVASHDRPLCWVPVPQVTVHSVHSDHSDQGDQPSSLSWAGRSKSTNILFLFFCTPSLLNIKIVLAKDHNWTAFILYISPV